MEWIWEKDSFDAVEVIFFFLPTGNVLCKQKKRNKAEKRVSPISILHLWEICAV